MVNVYLKDSIDFLIQLNMTETNCSTSKFLVTILGKRLN